jgi:hypothetical protein
MKTSFKSVQVISLVLVSAAALVSCSGASSSGDAGDSGAAGSDGGVTLFGLSKGTSCFDIVSIQGTPNDDCDLMVAAQVGKALPVNYDDATAILKVGTDGSLGGGVISFNAGTLTRTDGVVSAGTCTWHQKDTSTVTVTATNEFTISVTEDESMFAAACTDPPPPTGGMCTSTWTWKMKKSGTKLPTTTPPCI